MSELWKDAFDSVHAEEQLKRHTKEYLRKKVYAPRRTRAAFIWRNRSGSAVSDGHCFFPAVIICIQRLQLIFVWMEICLWN